VLRVLRVLEVLEVLEVLAPSASRRSPGPSAATVRMLVWRLGMRSLHPAGMLDAAEVEAVTQRFRKALPERALGAELQHHVTQEAGAAAQ
jgi:hypothetical protein